MKVAIVGAGLSGLACGLMLQRHGIYPDIFEKKSHIGDELEFSIVTLRIFSKFYRNPSSYFYKNYKVRINPIGKVKKIIMICEDKKVSVTGNLGYLFYKGRDEKSLENQLAKEIKVPIIFDTFVNPLDIMDKYDYVVFAGADTSIAKELGLFQSTFNGHSRIASVLGKFNPNTIVMYMNTEYANNGYAYFIPYSEERGNLILSVNNIAGREVDYYWKKFLNMEDITSTIIETRDVEHSIGITYPLKYKNLYILGAAGSCMDSFLGFGCESAMEAGVLAALSIAKGIDYNRIMEPFINHLRILHEYRKLMNSMDNNDFKRLITFLASPGIKNFIYNNPLYKAEFLGKVLKKYNSLTGKA